MKRLRHWRAYVFSGLLLLAAVFVAAFLLGGCAVGRNETTGGVVVGFEVAKLAETANQAITAAADAIFGPVGAAATGGVLGLAGIAAKLWASSARRAGRDEGWDERERAAGVQLAMPVHSSPVVGGVLASPTSGVGGALAPSASPVPPPPAPVGVTP